MQPVDVALLAQSFAGTTFRESRTSDFGTHVAIHGNTTVYLGFGDDGLETAIYSWTHGIKQASFSLGTDLCAGERYVHVRLHAPSEVAGALVHLDGRPVDTIAKIGVADARVPLGSHQVSASLDGRQFWSETLTYGESSDGYDIVSIPATVALKPE